MGFGPWRTSVQAIFYGDDYETRLQEFLAILLQPGSGELIHPVFGSFPGVLATKPHIKHDADSPDQAQVSIDFVQSIPSSPFFSYGLVSQKAEAVAQHGTLATAAATNSASSLIERLHAANPLAGLDALRDKLTAPILAITSSISVVLSGLDVLAYPRAWGNDISAMVGGLLDARDWSQQLEADWASIKSKLDSFSIFSTPATSGSDAAEVHAINAVAVTIQVNTAVGLANAASYVLASEAITSTLPPSQIEAICNAGRIAIEAAMEQVRVVYGIEQSRTITEPLKDQALALQEAGRAIIEARPPLILRTVDAPGNMRLLAHLWYGDHTRAPELYRLNGARSPFVNAGDSIRAYAS
jgi:prophage DNA circulation protein